LNGRIGYVIDGFNEREPGQSGRQFRCNGCREWHPADTSECPSCGTPRPGFNKWLRTANLNSHLFGAAERTVKEDQLVARNRAA
jgi:hypothetical protein